MLYHLQTAEVKQSIISLFMPYYDGLLYTVWPKYSNNKLHTFAAFLGFIMNCLLFWT
jgi:hypothetical protein